MARGGPSAADALRTLLSAAAEEWRATPIYRLALSGPEPDRLQMWGMDPRAGDPRRGEDILAGRWRIASERLSDVASIPWGEPPPSPHFSARLHSFSWLRDLAAAPDPAKAALIHALIVTWVDGFGAWHPQAWAPELTAERLYAWLCWGRPAFEGEDPERRPELLRSLARQARHLAQASNDIREPLMRVKAGAALTLAGLAGGVELQRLTDQGLELLEEAAASQFTPDGLHLSRAPEANVDALADLLTVDDALARKGMETPSLLSGLARKLTLMLRYLQLGDGGVASFHGGAEADPATLARLLEHVDPAAQPYRIAPSAGFFRLAAGDTALVLDGAAAPPLAHGARAHAGALAFEMSSGADRLIVNVGSGRELLPEWRAAGRGTNGHSTLILDDELSAEFEAPRLGRGAARPIGPPGTSARRADDEDGARIEARHEGYRGRYGLVHGRTVFLDRTGTRVVGLDQVFKPVGERRGAEFAIPFAIRFHLHPGVMATQRGASEVRLETPGGAHWRVRTDASMLSIEESVYLSGARPPQRALQLVIRGEADPDGAGETPPNRVIWTMTRIDQLTAFQDG